MHHIYSATNCLRCKIVKNHLTECGQSFEETDFQAQKEDFNNFYRTNRAAIYRNPEGVEFPIYTDGKVIKQGSGEVIAYLLAKHELEACVKRSDLLHGWISGLYPSFCPTSQEDNFIKLVEILAKGGLSICIRTDGRNSSLLHKLSDKNLIKKLEINILGDNSIYKSQYSHELDNTDLLETIKLAKKYNSSVCLQLMPLKDGNQYRYLSKEEAANAAKMLAKVSQDKQLPFYISQCKGEELEAIGLAKKLEELQNQDFFKYRTACREFLFKTDILKD